MGLIGLDFSATKWSQQAMNVIICKKANATKIDIKIICYLFCESYESRIIYYKEYIYIFTINLSLYGEN